MNALYDIEPPDAYVPARKVIARDLDLELINQEKEKRKNDTVRNQRSTAEPGRSGNW